jgi:type IV secretory pathway TrbD component
MARRFVAETLRMLSGLLVWGAHFGLVYVITALACARRFYALEWQGIGLVVWVVAIATLAAIASVLAIALPVWRHIRRHGAPDPTSAFIDWLTVAFGGLALVAIVWEGLPVLLVPICK